MNKIIKCEREIEKAKIKLLKTTLCENFGQNEIYKIKNKFDDLSYSQENNKIKDLINEFDNWCCGVTYKDLQKKGK